MVETMQLALGVDGGGTKTHAWLAGIEPQGSFKLLGKGQGEASNFQTVGGPAAQAAILAAMRGAFAQAGLSQQKVAGLCLGLAGVDRPEDQLWAEQWVAEAGFCEHLVVVNDGFLPLWGGTPEGWGLGLIAGTGSICLGRSPEGRLVRSGGWGYIFGDEGSGAALGIGALRVVSWAADWRAKPTGLTGHILKYFGVTDMQALIPLIYRNNVTPQELAALAPLVSAAAEEGDEAACAIRMQAAADLGALLASTYQRLEMTVEAPVALGGGVLAHDSFICEQTLVEARRRGVKVGAAQVVTEPVVGAVKLAIATVRQAGRPGPALTAWL